jgi:glycosyltransferase involved in cell wall biosynthesis
MHTEQADICFPFIGDEIGGSHISAIRLIRGLNENGIRTLVALHNTSGHLAAFLTKIGIRFEQAPVSPLFSEERTRSRMAAACRLAGQAAFSAVGRARFLASRGVYIVHTNDGRVHLQWALPARLSGARQVWHHRGDPDAVGVNLFAGLVASHVIAVSEFARPNRPAVNFSGRLSVVYSPFESTIDISKRAQFRDTLLNILGCDPTTGLLGYFGLLIDRKRPLEFVEAVAAFSRAHPRRPVMGLLFGAAGTDPPDIEDQVMRKAAELGIGDRIRLMGFRTPVEPWLMAVDVLLVPAVREPFGRTLIEAMLLGTPVIASDDGGNREAIEHGRTGILVPPGRAEAFVLPVYRLLTDKRFRDDITGNARRKAVATYGAETHVRRVMEIYESLRPQKAWSPFVQPTGG